MLHIENKGDPRFDKHRENKRIQDVTQRIKGVQDVTQREERG